MLSLLTLAALIPVLALANPIQPRQAYTGYIHADGTNQCLQVTVPVKQLYNGAPVVVASCGSANLNLWDIADGANAGLIVSGTQGLGDTGSGFCLDSTTQFPGNFQSLKVWSCYPGAPQQAFFYTGDERIAVTGGTACLDSGNNGQYYQCTTGNTNQIWTIGNAPPPTSTTSIKTTTVSSTSVSTSTPITPPPPAGKHINPKGDTNFCLTVTDIKAGAAVQNLNCASAANAGQYWQFTRDAVTQVQLSGTNFCLKASSRFDNGASVTIDTCSSTEPTQRFWYTGPADNHISAYSGTTCLDVTAENPSALQMWACSGPDPQQKFTS